jgi:hypothetical protein
VFHATLILEYFSEYRVLNWMSGWVLNLRPLGSNTILNSCISQITQKYELMEKGWEYISPQSCLDLVFVNVLKFAKFVNLHLRIILNLGVVINFTS